LNLKNNYFYDGSKTYKTKIKKGACSTSCQGYQLYKYKDYIN